MRKCISMVLLIALLVSVMSFPVPAEEIGENLIRNGDLEQLSGDKTTATKWSHTRAATITHDKVHSGESAVKIHNTGAITDSNITQRVKIIPGATYRAKAWVYVKNKPAETSVLFSLAYYDYLYESAGGKSYSNKDIAPQRWQEIEQEIVIPEEPLREANFRVRLYNGEGEIYVDDISLELVALPETTVVEPEQPDPIYVIPPFENKAPAPGHSELLTNTDLETLNADGSVKDWSASGGKWNREEGCIAQSEVVHSGKTALKIVNTLDTTDSHITQKLKLVPGATYQASVWVNIGYLGQGTIRFSVAYWANNFTDYIGGFQPTTLKETKRVGEWFQYIVHFIAQDMGDCEVEFRVRMMNGDGEAYFDDVSLYMIEEAPMITLDPGERFYYTELENGFASAKLNKTAYPELGGGTVDFLLKDGDTVIDQKMNASMAGDDIARWYFDLTQLEIGKDYTLEGVLKDMGGNVLDVQTELLQRHMPRPKALTEEGFYKTQVVGADGTLCDKLDENGEPEILDVMLAYTRPEDDADLKYLKEHGATAFIQSAKQDINADNIGGKLDAAHALGLKAVVGLYPDMKPAGYPTSIERTTYYIEKYKNHPAVLGWAVLDEPSSYFKFWELEALMETSYKLIRSLDPVHPVYAIEATREFSPLISKYVDIMSSDPYMYSYDPRAGHTSTFLREVTETREYIKPGCSVVQLWLTGGYFPTSMDVRHFFYESLFEGTTMLGYYRFKDSGGTSVNLNKTEIWDDLVKFGTGGEQRDAFDYFAYRKYPTFSESSIVGAEEWHAAYVKDGKLYMLILNMDDENLNAAPCTVSIPLVSDDGSVTVEGFTATLLSGEGEASITGDGSTLTVPLSQNACVLYEITPKNSVDFSGLPVSKFMDLGRYPWAAGAIRTLEEKGIVEGLAPQGYMPGYKITRGDFAMNLVRTLGLTADTAENFADVDAGARYAKEIAVGRALGIFKGQGENQFNPDAEISRQDMMVICARGMRAAGKLSEEPGTETLAAFSDSALLADYAAQDMAAMVANGIIKGNADGTLNPLGNATRAEAAVIMSRLL